LPGYGFSSRPSGPGWGSERIGKAFEILMKRLGYSHYVVQGGDWGSVIAEAMGRQGSEAVRAIHVNLPAAVPPEIEKALGGPAPAGISDEEHQVFDALNTIRRTGGLNYSLIMGARPQAVGYGLTDSPAGLAAFLLIHPGFSKWTFGDDPGESPTKDDVLDDFTLYWLTNSASSAARIYWEERGKNVIGATSQKTMDIKVPVAVTAFPDDIFSAPETWARRAFPTLIYYHKAVKGGHFAAWEQPQLFTEELRAAFKTLR
jgi:pimeloyl-ACP methyl ester carboxylesterase